MPRERDSLWEHITKLKGTKVKCNFCQEVFVGGITRMRYHFAKVTSKDVRTCPSVSNNVRIDAAKGVQELETKNKRQKLSEFWKPAGSSSGSIAQVSGPHATQESQSNNATQITIDSMVKKSEKEEADKAIVRCIVNNNLPFILLRSPYFREALSAVAKVGPGYVPPSSETARTKLLENLKLDADDYVNSIKDAWKSSGCTIMSDSWTDGRNRPYLNLLASCPKCVVFLKSLCTTGSKKDAQYIFEFISKVIEDIGPQNIIQFVSDNASNYLAAENLIMDKYPHIFKVNCAAHCINLMFKEFDKLEYVSSLLESARKIVKFIYRYQHVSDLMRAHMDKRELKRSGATRFATQFICLQSILKEEQPLRYMVASSQWRELAPCKSSEGIEIQHLIQGNVFWECGKVLITAMEPLFKVLRMVDGDGSTTGYIYYALLKAKEVIKNVFNEDSKRYLPFWKIIDERWERSLYNDIHMVAFYLNPHLFHDGYAKMDIKVRTALERVFSKMLTFEEKIKIVKELKDYHSKDPSIFGDMAIESLNVAHPRIWWDMWGSFVPTLQKLAIEILSQTCSASACERNWSAFEATHTKKRNRLNPTRLQDLVYVRMNNNLKKTMREKEQKDSIPIDLNKIESDITYIFYGDGDIPIDGDQEEIVGDDDGDEDDSNSDHENDIDDLNALELSLTGI